MTTENKNIERRLVTIKDYDKYIQSLQKEAETLHIQLLDISCDLSAVKRKIEVASIERSKKIAKKAKKESKKAGVKS